MDSHEDGFVVFVRVDPTHECTPESVEQPLRVCPSYEEARQLQRSFRGSQRECVIRYLGPAGGGD